MLKVIDCYDIAKQAIRSTFLSWGVAWTKIDPETRKAYLALAIVEYMSGMRWPNGKEWESIHERPWTAKNVRHCLEICKTWSETDKDESGNTFGTHLICMAARDENDPNDPITNLEEHFRRIYG